MDKYGLLGRNISYSFSRTYFREKFQKLQLKADYENFDLQDLSTIEEILAENQELKGLNVTIPYKEEIIPFLDEVDPVAKEIGAVNTIKLLPGGKTKGYNTDAFGFRESIRPLLEPHHKKALILGTGGASKAISYSLNELNIVPVLVSRSPGKASFSYDDLDKTILEEHYIIINCTPLGTFPKVSDTPQIPFEHLTDKHLIYDLIYNPAETQLMTISLEKGAKVTNGLQMLKLQAEKAWEIWNS